MKICMVSACLLGLATRYDGGSAPVAGCLSLRGEYIMVPFCPEQLGGLATPRPPAEIRGGDGSDVIRGRARVVRIEDGHDLTPAFIRGAEQALEMAGLVQPEVIFMKGGSPSCGYGRIIGVCAVMFAARGYALREFA